MCCAPLIDGLDARTTEPVDRERRHFLRHAGLEPDVPRAVMRIDAALLHVAEHDVVDPLGLRAGPLERRLRRDRAEIDRRKILQRAHVLRHGRTRAAQNEYLFCHHCCSVEFVFNFFAQSSRHTSRVPERAADVGRGLAFGNRRFDGGLYRLGFLARAPSVSSISADDRIAPIGLATFFPASGGAEPCTGSNSEVLPG